eukprot:4681187-Prymnesium_polylepis.1
MQGREAAGGWESAATRLGAARRKAAPSGPTMEQPRECAVLGTWFGDGYGRVTASPAERRC